MTEIYGTIYHITNVRNGKVYIGQTVQSYHKRCKDHFCRVYNNTHHNPHLQSAIRQDGTDNFITGSLYVAHSKEELDTAENLYISSYDSLNPDKGYNLKSGGANGRPSQETRNKLSAVRKGKKLSPEHRAKLSAANMGRIPSPETRTKLSAAAKGRKLSPEHRKKLSRANKGLISGMNGKTHSPETRAKMSAVQKGRIFSPEHCAKISAAQRGKKRGSYKRKAP